MHTIEVEDPFNPALMERLRSPPLSHGIARELRKQQSILERGIAELEQA